MAEIPVKTKSPRRCLFGRPERDEIDSALGLQHDLLFKNEAHRFKMMWGLDPVTEETVTDALFECTPVLNTKNIPSFYSRGYASRKSRHISRVMRENGDISPSLGHSDNALKSRSRAKRKLDLDVGLDLEPFHNENFKSEKRVPCISKGDLLEGVEATVLALSESANYESYESSTSPSCGGQCSGEAGNKDEHILHGLPRSIDKRTEFETPPSRLTQSSIKDFLPLKKPRLSKSLPRT